jgi:tRNA pseudouridine38-40 synthase
MIRIIVGRLLEIGRGDMSVDEFEHYLAIGETPKVIIPAYPQGLYLSKVTYPYLDVPAITSYSAGLRDVVNADWLAV